ncbi:MAG: hypothetical protein ACOX6Q_03020 [Candidatus Dojkabacteria bacterium]|jgi:hypothetical protein
MNKSNKEQSLNKQKILSILKQYNLNKDDFIIITGAAMVLHDIRETTHDIDIIVTENLQKEILNKYPCKLEKDARGIFSKLYSIDNIIEFTTPFFANTEWEYNNGYKVQTLKSLLELKKKTNRKKDRKDIQMIEKYIQKHQ